MPYASSKKFRGSTPMSHGSTQNQTNMTSEDKQKVIELLL